MSNYNPFMGMYYQIWMVPNMFGNASPYYTPIPIYPQIMPTTTINGPAVLPVVDQEKKLEDLRPKPEQKIQPKPIQIQSKAKNQSSKQTVQNQQNVVKQTISKTQIKKPKRPQTYLTEKAFYMRQKLKGKQKNGLRILRKRKSLVQTTKIKAVSNEKSAKKQVEQSKTKIKKMPIMKHSEKEKKIINKIRQKLLDESLDENAKIPKIISGLVELNEHCRIKMENLMSRRISKD